MQGTAGAFGTWWQQESLGNVPWLCRHRNHLPWSLGASGALSRSDLGVRGRAALIGQAFGGAQQRMRRELHPALAASWGPLQLWPSRLETRWGQQEAVGEVAVAGAAQLRAFLTAGARQGSAAGAVGGCGLLGC